jgi:hypothetical protein
MHTKQYSDTRIEAGSTKDELHAPAPGVPHRLADLKFYRGGFVLDTASGMFYRLTPAADYLLRSYDAGCEVRQFADLIQSRYGLDHASAVRDVELLLNQFMTPGLLETSTRADA